MYVQHGTPCQNICEATACATVEKTFSRSRRKRKFACQQFQHHVDVKERPCCNLMPSEKETEKS